MGSIKLKLLLPPLIYWPHQLTTVTQQHSNVLHGSQSTVSNQSLPTPFKDSSSPTSLSQSQPSVPPLTSVLWPFIVSRTVHSPDSCYCWSENRWLARVLSLFTHSSEVFVLSVSITDHSPPTSSSTHCSQEFYTRDSEEALVLTDHLLWSNWTRAQCPVLVDDGGGRCGDLRSVFVSGLSQVFFFFLKTQSPKNNEDP